MRGPAIAAAVAAFCIAAMSASPAAAEARFSYADLNLASPEGARVLDARIRNAARHACGERMGRESLREYLRVRACKRSFEADARARLASA